MQCFQEYVIGKLNKPMTKRLKLLVNVILFCRVRFMEIQRNIKGFSNASEYMRRRVEKRERGSPHPTHLPKVETRTNLPHSSVTDSPHDKI